MADSEEETPSLDGLVPWQDELLALNLENVCIAWAKLHIQKHAAESMLQEKAFVRNVFAPLLTKVLPHARSTWSALDSRLRRELDAQLAIGSLVAG